MSTGTSSPFTNHSDIPLITVQIAMHDGDARYARRCLDSVEAQEVPPGQLQVVIAYDGLPSDEAEGLLSEASAGRPFPIHLLGSPEPTGYYTVPRNRALPGCWGFYMAHLDADNEYLAGHLRGLLTAIRTPHPTDGWPHFVYSRREYVCDRDGPDGTMHLDDADLPRGRSPLVEWTLENIARLAAPRQERGGNFIDTGDFLIGRSALYELAERSGCVWNNNSRRYGDWDLVLRLANYNFRGQAVDQVTHRYHWTGQNLQTTRAVSDINFIPADVYEALQAQGKIRD